MQWLPLCLVSVATAVYAGVCAGEDAYHIARNADVSHLWQARQRGTVLAGFALLAYHGWLWPLAWGWPLLAPLCAAAMAACWFGLLFDVWLNQRRQLAWHYSGVDPNTARADKLVARLRLSGPLYPALKAVGVLAFGTAALLLSR